MLHVSCALLAVALILQQFQIRKLCRILNGITCAASDSLEDFVQ